MYTFAVATREGGVDRNMADATVAKLLDVATREGGVDRNRIDSGGRGNGAVATREGGVDRNIGYLTLDEVKQMSPPARVAWIET